MAIRVSARVRREIRNGGAAAIEARIRAMRSQPNAVAVGFPNGTDPEQVMKATFAEFGTVNQLARPFFTNAMRDGRRKYRAFLARSVDGLLLGETSLSTVLNRLGLVAVGDIQEAIGSNTPPPLAPATIARKGSSRTLVDTGALRQSVRHELRMHQWGSA
jgi:hypothetical protein